MPVYEAEFEIDGGVVIVVEADDRNEAELKAVETIKSMTSDETYVHLLRVREA